ncbi:hypothetical protein PROSTU_01413 [Providencia stuartii ATCC 25827]|uniref:Uncharacterized protein n=1 Tax=Providencia stuartii ATCC 25827 TaxID=471874 RepID=A0AA86YNA8_PROST|nr:hypothetical protein PROSTU_01413 [Providencia stuartii ATCC 25827]
MPHRYEGFFIILPLISLSISTLLSRSLATVMTVSLSKLAISINLLWHE